jgi:hypothetical protein
MEVWRRDAPPRKLHDVLSGLGHQDASRDGTRSAGGQICTKVPCLFETLGRGGVTVGGQRVIIRR